MVSLKIVILTCPSLAVCLKNSNEQIEAIVGPNNLDEAPESAKNSNPLHTAEEISPNLRTEEEWSRRPEADLQERTSMEGTFSGGSLTRNCEAWNGQSVRAEIFPGACLMDCKGLKVVAGGNVQLLLQEERTFLGQGYAADIRVEGPGKSSEDFLGFDEVVRKEVVYLDNAKSESIGENRKQFDDSLQENESQKIEDDIILDHTNLEMKRETPNPYQASLFECGGSQVYLDLENCHLYVILDHQTSEVCYREVL